MLENGLDYVVMGHRHRPVMIEHSGGYYINLGDWIDHFSYGIYENGNFELKTFYDLNYKGLENKKHNQ